MTIDDTIAACLTPPSAGAIATIAIRGPAVWQIIRSLLEPQSQFLCAEELGGVWLTRLGRDVIDQVVLAVRESSPVPWVEVHCHGGNEIVRVLLEAIGGAGARLCSWQEFVRLVSRDPLQALAGEQLALARTMRTAAVLLTQRDGAFRKGIELILFCLDSGSTAAAHALLRGLIELAPLGRHLVDPWKVVIAGAPNVGKSSLVNTLAGYQRSIESPIPGTTRDVVTTTIALAGWPVELADTAGLRQTVAALESEGIERARSAATAADLCLWVLDVAAEPIWPDISPERLLLVVNKIDLAAVWDVNQAANAIRVSARTGAGIPELCEAIVRRFVPKAQSPGLAIPFTPALCDGIEAAYAHLSAGRIDETRRVLAELLGSPGGARP